MIVKARLIKMKKPVLIFEKSKDLEKNLEYQQNYDLRILGKVENLI